MPQTTDTEHHFDPTIQSEDIAFRPSQMVPCRGCSRQNPPNRATCVYCGHELAIADVASLQISNQQLEPWENGWNIVLLPNLNDPRPNVAMVASIVSNAAEQLDSIIDAAVPLPVARVSTEAEAIAASRKLSGLGLDCRTVPDVELDAGSPPVRLKGLDFTADRLAVTDFNTGTVTNVPWSDLALLVTGTLLTSRTDALEKKRRRDKPIKLIDETTTSSDAAVLDIYSRRDPQGWRIHLAGFDFSCLGDDKSLLAVENLRRLVTILKERAPHVRVVSNYSNISHALDNIWPLESRKDAQGLQRAGFGKVEFGSVELSNNTTQFTKYSRLQWHLL